MPAALFDLFNDLDLSKIRVVRPSRVIFLCGGTIAEDQAAPPESLRDYIYRIRGINRSIDGSIVLAEKAVQLYRDTAYDDLITFEEDIARLSSLVIVIAESPGSLAELGAFASSKIIFPNLRVIMREYHHEQESFIRFGPIQKVENGAGRNVGVYPWRVSSRGIIKTSIEPHYQALKSFVNSHLRKMPKTTSFEEDGRSVLFIVYWVIYICVVVSKESLYLYIKNILSEIEDDEIKNKLYCLQLAGWVERRKYSDQDYFYSLYDVDAFEYAFKVGVTDKDSSRRKLLVSAAINSVEKPPKALKIIANERRAR